MVEVIDFNLRVRTIPGAEDPIPVSSRRPDIVCRVLYLAEADVHAGPLYLAIGIVELDLPGLGPLVIRGIHIYRLPPDAPQAPGLDIALPFIVKKREAPSDPRRRVFSPLSIPRPLFGIVRRALTEAYLAGRFTHSPAGRPLTGAEEH